MSTTLDAVRIDMVEGQIEPCFGDEIAKYNRSSVELWLKNGAYLKGYSSERPRRLRGPNFHLAWCFPAEAPVTMADGSQRPISEILVGDWVATPIGPRAVTRSGVTQRDAGVWALPLAGGTEVLATPEHPVWVEGRGYVQLREVGPGDRLQNQTSSLACAAKAVPHSVADVYDLTVETAHEFYAYGVRVHNCDEPANWLDAHLAPSEDSTWSNLEFACRLDNGGQWQPRIIATTTPKPVKLLRVADKNNEHYPGIVDDPDTVISNVRTYDNLNNLAASFRKRIARYEGTRLGAQELEGRLLSSAEHAMFTVEQIASLRIPLHRVLEPGGHGLTVVGVDPSVGDGNSDECGIVVATRLLDREGWSSDSVAVVDDRTVRGRPKEWAQAVAQAFYDWNADFVVVEVNQGGQMVGEVLHRYAPNLPIKEVWAKKGKEVRLEPVALLADQGRVRFAGSFLLLEDQLATFEPGDKQGSPDRLDAFVYACLFLLPPREMPQGIVSTVSSGMHAIR